MPICATCGHQSDAEFNFCPSCGAKSSSGETEGLVGRILNGKYKIVRPIGQGAMGVVYEGEHVALQKRVALKVLHPDLGVTDDSLRRFQQEGIAAGRFTHPGAIQIFDFDREGDRILYLAMEYLDGEDLKHYLKRKGRLAPVEAVAITRQILSVLAEAHALGIVHRDLKPDNVMVLKHSGENVQVKVLDFGLSKLVDVPQGASMQTQVGRIMGTPLYMAPEQVAGEEVDHRADIYAMGLILYELLAGLTPFPDQTTTEILFTRATREAPSIRSSFPDLGITSEIDVVLRKALQRRREERYQSAAEMLADLEAITVPAGAGGSASTRASVSRSAARTRPMLDAAQPEVSAAGGASKRTLLIAGLFAGVALVLFAGVLGVLWMLNLGGSVDSGSDGGASADGREASSSSDEDLPAWARQTRLRDRADEVRTPDEQSYVDRLDVAKRTLAAGDRDAALVHADDALALGFEDPEGFIVRASIQLEQGELAAAAADVERARALVSGDPEVETLAGWIQLEDERPDDAAASFAVANGSSVEAGFGEHLPAVAGAAAVLLWQGRVDEAQQRADSVVERDDRLAMAHRVLGEIALAKHDPDAAVTSLFRARSLDPSDWRTYLRLGEAYLLQGDQLKAEKQLVEARARNSNALLVRQRLASVYIERELWPEARDELRDALERFPGDGRLTILHGVLLDADGETEEAIDALESGLRAGVEDARAHTLLGILQHARGEKLVAQDHYESSRSLDDELALPWLNLGLLALETGAWEEARGLFEGALERDAQLSMAHFALGVVQRDYAGEGDAALVSFLRYRDTGGRDPRVVEWIDELGG